MRPRRFNITPEPPLSPVERFRLAISLSDELEKIVRQRLRSETPEADDDEIERRLTLWRHHRPGAELGDAAGRTVPWPRPK